jgi:hypothetical protein
MKKKQALSVSVSTCLNDLKQLHIDMSLEDIKLMSEQKFRNLLNSKLKESAFKYLKEKQKSKDKENIYEELSMSEYLLPTNNNLTITEKQTMFSVKNRMVRIPANFPKPKREYKCVCNEKEDLQHIYYCEILNNGRKTNIEYEKLYTGNISEQIEIWRHFERNMEEREKLLKEESSPRDPSVIHCIRQSIVMD